MRKSLSLLMATILILASAITSYGTIIKIDDKTVQFNTTSGAPFIDQTNRTQVPFRLTMEQFGCLVSWDKENKVAIAEKDDIMVEVPIGASYIIKNGQKISNDTVALIKDGRTYLPIRAVLEAFGAKVTWDSKTSTVTVYSKDYNNDNQQELNTYSLSGLEFTIGDVGLTNALNPYVLPDPGNYYVAFTVKIENKTASVAYVGPSNFAVATLDTVGTSAYADALAADYNGLIFENTSLLPGQWVHGLVVFEIPASNLPMTVDIGMRNIEAKTGKFLRFDVSKYRDMFSY